MYGIASEGIIVITDYFLSSPLFDKKYSTSITKRDVNNFPGSRGVVNFFTTGSH